MISSLISVAAVWLIVHQIIKIRLRDLKIKLPATYQCAIASPADDGQAPQLIALAIDLMRKAHCAVPFDDLTDAEKRVALHAYGIEALPAWMTRYAILRLRPSERALIRQLQQVHTSRPQIKPLHFGAIKQQQQLRSRP
jgi:hypothetical protein